MSTAGRPLGSLDSVHRGAIRGVALELRSKMLLRRHAPLVLPVRRPMFSFTDKMGIARALLQLQRQHKLIVWVDVDEVRIAPFGEVSPVRRRLTWEQAAKIADAPDKFLKDGLYVSPKESKLKPVKRGWTRRSGHGKGER